MADYVSREVARERLRKACKGGTFVSVLLLLLGIGYGGIAAIIGLNVKLPFGFLYSALYVIVPTMSDAALALAECATKAVLLVLMGFFGILMFHKVAKTGEAFRVGQLRQLKFVAFLTILLGFLPTLAGNLVKVIYSMQQGGPALAVMSFAIEPMCIVAGLMLFMGCRVLVAGSRLGTQEEAMADIDPQYNAPEPDYADVPDLGSVPTATPVEDGLDNTAWRPPEA